MRRVEKNCHLRFYRIGPIRNKDQGGKISSQTIGLQESHNFAAPTEIVVRRSFPENPRQRQRQRQVLL